MLKKSVFIRRKKPFKFVCKRQLPNTTTLSSVFLGNWFMLSGFFFPTVFLPVNSCVKWIYTVFRVTSQWLQKQHCTAALICSSLAALQIVLEWFDHRIKLKTPGWSSPLWALSLSVGRIKTQTFRLTLSGPDKTTLAQKSVWVFLSFVCFLSFICVKSRHFKTRA